MKMIITAMTTAAMPPKPPSPMATTSIELLLSGSPGVVWKIEMLSVVDIRDNLVTTIASLEGPDLLEVLVLLSTPVWSVMTVKVSSVTTSVSPVDLCTSGVISCANCVWKRLKPTSPLVVLVALG